MKDIVYTYKLVYILIYYSLFHNTTYLPKAQSVTRMKFSKNQTDYTRLSDKLHEVFLPESDRLHDVPKNYQTNYTRFFGPGNGISDRVTDGKTLPTEA